MSVATSTAIGLGIAGAGLVGGVASSAIGANAAGNAASTQANSANYAANLQAQEAQNALNFQEQQYGQGQQDLQPWLQSGTGALSQLDYLLGVGPQSPSTYGGAPQSSPVQTTAAPGQKGLPAAPTYSASPASTTVGRPLNTLAGPTSGLGNNPAQAPAGQVPAGAQPGSVAPGGYGSLLQGFQAPTAAQAAATPGYQFQLGQGENAIQNSAAARGGLLSGNLLQSQDQYAQGLASTNYEQAYNNAFNTFQQNQANTFNRLGSLAGIGQQAAGQLNTAGQQAAGNVANISQNAGAQIGQSAQNAGAATASGYVGGANAINSGIGSAVGSAQQGLLLSQLLGGQNNVAPGNYAGAG